MADKNDITNNKNSLSLEEESILKNAMIFLQEEYNIKKDKLKLLRQELTQTKRQFQSQLQEYQKEIKLTINIIDLEDGKQLVRETNGGVCGETNFNSLCTTDMNITKDKEENLISYSEII